MSPVGIARLSWLLTMTATLTVGCDASERPVSDDDDVIRVVVGVAPATFDPRVGADEASRRIHQLVYSPLMTVGPDQRAAPGLAARLDNPDPLTYIAYLRSGVRFHDGHELTAADVVYTFNSVLDPAFASPRQGDYAMLRSVAALGTYRVEFRLKEPFSAFPLRLVTHVVPDGAGDSLLTFPIGTGPYRFVRYVANKRVELSAYEGYWDGLPQNAGVILHVVTDDRRRELELRSRAADLVIDDIRLNLARQLASDGFTIYEASDTNSANAAHTGRARVAVSGPHITGVRLSEHAGFLTLMDVKKATRNK